jgi:hypothetical protein
MEGSWIAHLPVYAGCFTTASTAEAAVAALPEGLRGYQQWRRAHGDETFAVETASQFVVVEQNGRHVYVWRRITYSRYCPSWSMTPG